MYISIYLIVTSLNLVLTTESEIYVFAKFLLAKVVYSFAKKFLFNLLKNPRVRIICYLAPQ